MPYPRPVSPLSLETCDSLPYDIGDSLVGSDDELDDAAKAVQRQRIENLAQSYLQGKPLFILSASLKGPLDEGWENPWKKNRKRRSSPPARSDGKATVPELIIEETDLRASKHRESLPIGGRGPEIPESSLNTLGGASAQTGNRSSSSKSPRRDSSQSTSRPARAESNGALRSPGKSSAPSSSVNGRMIAPPRSGDWLKKDRRLMNFTKFDPPSSPTVSVASRHLEKVRRPTARSVQVQVPQTPGSPTKPQPSKNVPAKTTRSISSARPSPSSSRSATKSPRVPQVSAKSPFRKSEADKEPQSLRIVNSSSQLPRFEYRRSNRDSPSLSPGDESILQEETILHDDSPTRERSEVIVLHDDSPTRERPEVVPSPVSTSKDRPSEPAVAVVPEKPPPAEPLSISPTSVQKVPLAKPDLPEETAHISPTGAESHKTQSKDLRFADEEDIVNEDDNATHEGTAESADPEQNTTEQNTLEDLPSAQRVPAPLGASDRIISLHSTAMANGDTDPGPSTSPDTQLSTQAALLHAQKSFQEDLDSPAYYATTPGQNQAVHSPSGTSYSANVTPFYRIEESIRRDQNQAAFSTNKERMYATSTQFMLDQATPFNLSTELASPQLTRGPTNRNMTQAMNTQFMLDAATPYAFSTEKKQRTSRPDSPNDQPTGSKRKRSHDASPSRHSSPGSDSTGMDYEYHSAESNSGGDRVISPPGSQNPDHPSITDASLPLDLDEATPAMDQDGQGAHQAVDSFNLSQAIADAGSWLQQSFDFMKDAGIKDTRRSGQTLSSQGLNMDLS